jgi:hypothetical protein
MNHDSRNNAHSRVKKKKKADNEKEYGNKIIAEIVNLGSKRPILVATAIGSTECRSL